MEKTHVRYAVAPSILAAVLLGLVSGAAPAAAPAAPPAAPNALEAMPIREVTAFKDGHAFVLHEGAMPTDDAGRVVLDYLPAPVLGTFWPYAADPKAKLTAVVAGRRRVSVERTALTVAALVEGNVGAKVRIREWSSLRMGRVVSGLEAVDPMARPLPPRDVSVVSSENVVGQISYEATIVGVPARSGEELARTSPPGAEERLPQKGNVVLLKTAEGVKAVPVERIESVTFVDEPKAGLAEEEFRNMLTLRLDWQGGKPAKQAKVGMVYLQRGIRWIPNYRIEIDGKGKAHVRLQATVVNELADLADVKVHLVVGVPTFAFQESVDPMSLQQAVAQLSSHFRRDAQTAYAFSNAIMSQSGGAVRGPGEEGGGGPVVDLGPEIAGSAKSEDLFVFTVDHVTLKKGERMVLPVAEYDLEYKDVFVLDLPFGPPPEARANLNSEQQIKLARLMGAPKVMHAIRLVNKAEHPLTTAPALILRDGRLLAQGMTKYTAVGATSDLEITTAVDVSVEKVDREVGRKPNAANWHGNNFDEIDLAGEIHLTNRRGQAVDLEVTRYILGVMDEVGQDGKLEQLSWSEGGWLAFIDLPEWWYWHNWPHWWYRFNGVGRATWKVTLEPGKTIDLTYKWHYLWG